jgi:hypothetical protein
MSVLATIEPANLSVDAGAETSLVVRVRNRGTIVDQFDIHVVGPTAGWATVDPPSLRLFPDKEGEARVTFRPPRAPEPNADTYPFGIAVRASADPTAATVEEGHIVVAPFVQLASSVVPHDVTVKNIGNAVAEVTVTASDPDRLLGFEVTPERAGLRPGGSAVIRTRVKPKSTFFMGGSKRVPFSIQIDEPNAGSYQVPATLEQRPLIPGWIKVAAGLLVASIAAVTVLPRMLGIDLAGATPSAVAVVTPSPTPVPITEPPITEPPITEPPATEAPTPTPGIIPPDTLTVPSQKQLNGDFITLICPTKNSCRTEVTNRIMLILKNLQSTPTGVRYDTFGQFPVGTLPITVEWKTWHYPYGSSTSLVGNLNKATIDLAPTLVGGPAYVLIRDIDTGPAWYTISADDASFISRKLFIFAVDPPPPDVELSMSFSTYYQRIYADSCILEACVFVNP